MATYFKYAERSAESQVNWSEVGKNMTDMLQEQARLRQDKINALDESARQFGEELANAPQGEHKGINQWGLEFGADASEYMLMKQKLWKSGKTSTKDYLIGTQNIMDGTKQAFNLMKEFQASFSEKMERSKKGDSQDIELWLNAQAEKFGDFTKSQLYINPTDGTVSVAMRERQVIGGKEVFVMNKNPNDFATINSLRNQIAGRYDKYDTDAVTTAFADSLGKQETSQLFLGTLISQGKNITTEDIKSRVDLDVDGKTEIFKFMDAENQMIDAALENPFNRLSVLTNSRKFAENGEQYTFTYDEADAKANPEKVLLRIGQGGQPIPEFSKEQIKDSQDFMRAEVRAKYDYKQVQSVTPQTSQLRAPTQAETGRADKKKDAANVAENLVFALTGDANKSSSGTKFLSGLTGLKFEKTKDSFIVVDADENQQTYNLTADGKVADPTTFVKSFIGPIAKELNINQDDIIKKFGEFLPKGASINLTTEATGFDEGPQGGKSIEEVVNVVNENLTNPTVTSEIELFNNSVDMAAYLNNNVASNLGTNVSFSDSLFGRGNIFVTIGDKESSNFSVGSADKNKLALSKMKQFIIDNLTAGGIAEEKEMTAESAIKGMRMPATKQAQGTTTTKGGASQFNQGK